jgi:hypothetical protein
MQEPGISSPGLPPSPHIASGSGAYDRLTSHFQQLLIVHNNNNSQAVDFSHLVSQDGGGNEIVG